MKIHLIILFSILFLSSCGDDTFKKVEVLNEFRVLAIVANDSELAPGGSTNVFPLISDIKGGRTVQGEVISCIDPGVSRGAPVSCDHDPSASPVTYNVDTSTLTLGAQNTGQAPAHNITIPASIFTGRSDREKFNGVPYLVIFTFTVDGRTVKAFRRINATDRTQKNQNPASPVISINGSTTLNQLPTKGANFNLTTSAPESYQFITIDGTLENRVESLDVSWYLSSGEVDKPKAAVSESVEYEGETPTTSFLLMAIVRDERGGIGFKIEEIP